MIRVAILWLVCLIVLASVLTAQTPMTNEDVVTLGKAGLSEDFVLNLVQQQPSRFATDAGRLVELKDDGVSERLILIMVKRNPPQEPLTSYGLIRLAQSEVLRDFLLDLLSAQPVMIATDARNIIQLKEAGLSERVLSQIVFKSSSKPMPQGSGVMGSAGQQPRGTEARGFVRQLPQGTQVVVRLIDAIDSEKSKQGDTFRASLEEALNLGSEVVAPKGADATVKLVQSKESGKLTGRTELTVELASVAINGKQVPFNTSSVSQSSGSQGEKTAKTAAAVGAVGAIIGAIAGGGQGAAIGAGAGAAAGAGSQVLLGGQRVLIQSETVLKFTTAGPVDFL